MPLRATSWTWIFLSLGTAYSFGLHFSSLNQSSFANGWDSYFYLVQIKSYLEEGQMVSSRLSLFYPLLLGLQSLVQDYVLTWKITGALLSALFSLLTYGVLRAISPRVGVAALGFALAVVSPHLFYFSAQYLKNLMGMDLVLLLCILLFRKKMLWATLVVLLTLFTHKAAVGFGFVTFLIHLLLKGNKQQLRWILIGFALLAISSLIAPAVFSFNDLMRESSIFSDSLQFSYSHFIHYSGIETSHLWRTELLVTLLAAPLFWLLYRKNHHHQLLLVLCLHLSWLVFNLPIWSQEALGYGFRFFLQSALLAPLFIALCTLGVSKQGWLYATAVVVLASGPFVSKSYVPGSHDPPYIKYHVLANALETHPSFAHAELYIAHKGLAEYIKFSTGKDAMAWIPEYSIEPNNLWRLVRTTDYAAIYPYFDSEDEEVHWQRLSTLYFLVPENKWQEVFAIISSENPELGHKLSTWHNPSKQRPAYMSKYKKR